MRRILLLFSAVAIMAVVFAGPALANHEWWHFDDDDDDFGGFNFDGGELGFADQELESGDVENVADISIDGNNNNQCVGLSQFGSTGNFTNQQGFTSGDGGSGFDDDDNNHDDDDWWNHDDDDDNFDFSNDNGEFASEFSGGEFDFAPENETSCEQAVQQAAAASSF